MRTLILALLIAATGAAQAHGHVEQHDGVLYVYPDKAGRFDVDVNTAAGVDRVSADAMDEARDSWRATQMLASYYSEQGTVWRSSNPTFRYNDTVHLTGMCNCTVMGAPAGDERY